MDTDGRIGALSPSSWKKIVVAPLTDLAPPTIVGWTDDTSASEESPDCMSGRMGVKPSPKMVVAPAI